MFDVNVPEMLVIAVVALLVVGPKRLPGLAREAGLWLGRARRFVRAAQADVRREIARAEALDLERTLREATSDKTPAPGAPVVRAVPVTAPPPGDPGRG